MVRVPRLPEGFENRNTQNVEKIKEPWCVMLSKNGNDMHLTVWFSSKYVNLASSSLTQHKLSNVNISHFCIEQIQGKRKTT